MTSMIGFVMISLKLVLLTNDLIALPRRMQETPKACPKEVNMISQQGGSKEVVLGVIFTLEDILPTDQIKRPVLKYLIRPLHVYC